MTKTNFNIQAIREKQDTVTTLQAHCLFTNLSSNNDFSNPYYYGKNGKLRGWIVGAMVQGSKVIHRDNLGRFSN
tara:strand:+ start:85 stop:306 length:222 start_codon:yes stop_codon:yes gene_type:complete